MLPPLQGFATRKSFPYRVPHAIETRCVKGIS